MDHRELYIKIVKGEIVVEDCLELLRPLAFILNETDGFRKALDEAYDKDLAGLYFENINALLTYVKKFVDPH